MKTAPTPRQHEQGFTLIELLVVMGIIAILAAMLLPVIHGAIIQGQIKTARLDIVQLATAINSYHSAYGHFPVSSAVITAAQTAGPRNSPDDFSYGGILLANALGAGPWTTNNSEVIAILMDMTDYPINGSPTANAKHIKNPQQTKFLNAKMAGDVKSAGIGPDLVYRDPWGNPYVISMDLNYDEKCMDALYRKAEVSQNPPGQAGYNGLFNSSGADNFAFNGGVMVWSAGPDATIAPNQNAITPPNKDNLLSW